MNVVSRRDGRDLFPNLMNLCIPIEWIAVRHDIFQARLQDCMRALCGKAAHTIILANDGRFLADHVNRESERVAAQHESGTS